jgi:hypothetical protein
MPPIEELRRDLDAAERNFESALRRCEALGARAVRARILYERATAEPATVFRREGEFWTLAYAGRSCRVKDLKGLRYIAFLLGARGDVHVLELAAAAEGRPPAPVCDADARLDARAKDAFRLRLHELRDDLAQAQAWRDPERIARLELEIDALTAELARAAGLGGRDRRQPSPVERARVSVTKAIRTAIKAVDKHHPALAQHLADAVRTGRLCSYAPPGEAPPQWLL